MVSKAAPRLDCFPHGEQHRVSSVQLRVDFAACGLRDVVIDLDVDLERGVRRSVFTDESQAGGSFVPDRCPGDLVLGRRVFGAMR